MDWVSLSTLVAKRSWVSHLCSSVSERETVTTSWDECDDGTSTLLGTERLKYNVQRTFANGKGKNTL